MAASQWLYYGVNFFWEFVFCICGYLCVFFAGAGGSRPLLSKEGQKEGRKKGREGRREGRKEGSFILPSITPRTIIIITLGTLITIAYMVVELLEP